MVIRSGFIGVVNGPLWSEECGERISIIYTSNKGNYLNKSESVNTNRYSHHTRRVLNVYEVGPQISVLGTCRVQSRHRKTSFVMLHHIRRPIACQLSTPWVCRLPNRWNNCGGLFHCRRIVQIPLAKIQY